jgi:hypothetical protein
MVLKSRVYHIGTDFRNIAKTPVLRSDGEILHIFEQE